ncbi:hypothetical protein [Pseudogulbenkiania ferrooxidans]|uniref:Uncharacterized protein n=1 Tax=Pseudogulbenkiania ferrooxidans 2002 TaxID=279714 RepID=B9Z7T0_9NEIS|nr:hypothetical protein [Pseudogulbenkiania ferrooxidans]EEG07216.1 hypothetical protein FuraDRAFT_3416 [Pseudogulbenkiania ferrooxidans 2002]
MFKFKSKAKPEAVAGITSELVMFNYCRPARARRVALGSGGRVWLVETLDRVHGVWVWEDECSQGDQALEQARRLSLMLS